MIPAASGGKSKEKPRLVRIAPNDLPATNSYVIDNFYASRNRTEPLWAHEVMETFVLRSVQSWLCEGIKSVPPVR